MKRSGRRGIRRTVVIVALGGGVLLLGIGLLAGYRLSTAARDLRAANDLVDEAGSALEDGHLSEAQGLLADASPLVTSATSALNGHAELSVLGAVPFFGDDLDQLRESVGIAAALVNGGVRILRAAAPLQGEDGTLETPLVSGAIPLDAVTDVTREVRLLAGDLPAADQAKRKSLLGPVKELRDRVLKEAAHRRRQLDSVGAGLELLSDMAGGNGDRRYLIAVANTAEMRGSGGMILNYGVLIGHGGDFELDTFGRIDELQLPAPLPRSFVPDLPEDYLDRWAGFDPLLRWRNATLSADFEMTAPVLEAMYTLAAQVKADGVIQVDPQGLAAILQAIGPVDVPELGSVSSDNVVDLVLNQAYARFPDIDQRSDVLGQVAEATFRKLVDGQYDSLRPLGEAMLRAVGGRHLIMHSVASGAQRQLAYFDADGALPPLTGADAVALTVQNVSANKLDYYVDTALDLAGERETGRFGRVRATITVTNTAPPGVTEPRYVFGPFDDNERAGLYRGVVSLYLPAGTSLEGTSGDPLAVPPVTQSEAQRPVVGFQVDVPAGETRTVVLDLRWAPRLDGPYELLVAPSPRVRPTKVTVALSGAPAVTGQVDADRPWRLVAGLAPEAIAPPAGRQDRETRKGA
jgi:hypothetical protein